MKISREKSSWPTIGITLGDPAGIGPEVIKKALQDPKLPKGFRYEVIGSAEKVKLGESTSFSARIALAAMEESIIRWKKGELKAIVTGPVQKETLVKIGFQYPGQTEFFAAKTGIKPADAVMLLAGATLRVALCTTHCSLRQALRLLSGKKVDQAIEQAYHFLKKLGIRNPKIALAGVNPHASENGLFGDEEKQILQPAIVRAKKRGWNVTGPYSPDTVFYQAARGNFDVVICAYHDQGLIPFKLLDFSTGVNVTLGLPLIRTSPDHGTALNIAGKNKGDHRSMLEAIKLACRLAAKS